MRALAAVACAVALGLVGCGGDDGASTASTLTAEDNSATTGGATPTATTGVPEGGVRTGEETTSTSGGAGGGDGSGEGGGGDGGSGEGGGGRDDGEGGGGGASGGDGERADGGAGDEEPARVPVALTARSGALSPSTVTVPAFLTLEVRISGAPTTATLPGGARVAVPGTRTISGLKPGKYEITTASGGTTTLDVVNGGDPGP